MKVFRIPAVIILVLVVCVHIVFADTVTYNQNGYTLTVTDNASNFSATIKQNMINTFFAVYPQMVARFNPNATKSVTFVIDPNYTGVAYTVGTQITYSASYMASHPQDYDVVTHEAMHVVQAYSGSSIPGWATEGLADYARYKYGVNNAAAGWSLPNFSSSQQYTDSYRVTARFFVWLELRYGASILNNLNTAGRTNTYTSNFWITQTGKTIDQLWSDYAANPSISGPTPTPQPTPVSKELPGRIEAESYNAMSGIITESCSEGGVNIGAIDLNDWMEYNVSVATSGTYRIDYRVASIYTTGKVDFLVNGTPRASTSIPNTGNWQIWSTVSANVVLNAGAQTLRLLSSGGGWNINWFSGTVIAVTATPTPTPLPAGNDLCTGGTASASGDNASSGEGTAQAFDNSTSTKWLVFASTGWIQYDFAGTAAYAVNQYTITSANDATVYPGRNPKNWTLQGSNNGSTWTTVDTRTDVSFTANYQKLTFSFTNPTAYQMYRLNITANNGGNEIQLAEIEMFAGTNPTPTPTPTGGVIFYQNSNYSGTASQVFAKGTYTLAQLMAKGVSNDWMSSLRVPSGWTVIVYQHDNFGGTAWTFTADTSYVGSACNDQMSSVKIQ